MGPHMEDLADLFKTQWRAQAIMAAIHSNEETA